MEKQEIVSVLTRANTAYRSGSPILGDAEYDALIEDLRKMDPGHPFLSQVEPEPDDAFAGGKVRHATPMLSTDKAYTSAELAAFFQRVHAVAADLGITRVLFRATPKLDGLSGRYDGDGHLYSRGNGLEGQDISSAITKGLCIPQDAPACDGEIVVEQRFFMEHLEGRMFNGRILTHPRNFMVGFVGADELGNHHRMAVEADAARFVPYATLGDIQAEADVILDDIEGISRRLRTNCPYLTDGIVIEVINLEIRALMGATNHHHRWQIAYKTKGEKAQAKVLSITWQVGRTGRVTPVLEIEPTVLSGATIRRVTAHTASNVTVSGLGKGAIVEIIRSGEVIPKVESVIQPADAHNVTLPKDCPCCGSTLAKNGEYLVCTGGIECPEQARGILLHFCQTLEIIGFGDKIVDQLIAGGVDAFSTIFHLGQADYQDMGISPGIAQNLVAAVDDRKNSLVDDWRLLAAFGIRHLGRGDAKKLLTHVKIGGLNFIDTDFIHSIDGFGPLTSDHIALHIHALLPEINAVAKQLRIRHTMDASTADLLASPISGKRLVFTGTFQSADRSALESKAEKLGAKLQSSVNAKTDLLIIGEKPGSKKVAAAKQHGTVTLDEVTYLQLTS